MRSSEHPVDRALTSFARRNHCLCGCECERKNCKACHPYGPPKEADRGE